MFEKAINFLNLPNYAGGQKLWQEKHGKAAIGDGKLEVVSLKGSADVGLAAVGIKPVAIGQYAKIKIELLQECPVQMDGEPWIQEPCTIEISLLNQVPVLVSPLKPSSPRLRTSGPPKSPR